MAFYVLLGGSRSGQRIRCDREDARELRMRTADDRHVERYRPTGERRDGFRVALIARRSAGPACEPLSGPRTGRMPGGRITTMPVEPAHPAPGRPRRRK